MKDHLIQLQELLVSGDYHELKSELEKWDNPAEQLWGVFDNLVANMEDTPPEMNWNTGNIITREMGRELYTTKELEKLFKRLARDGYTALSLGLIIDLVRQLESK